MSLVYDFSLDVSYSHCKDDEADELYQQCFLNAFQMKEYDEYHWRTQFDLLYSAILNHPTIQHIVDQMGHLMNIPCRSNESNELDKFREMGLIFLFSYTYFEKFHAILQEWNNGSLDETSETYRDLLDTIQVSE